MRHLLSWVLCCLALPVLAQWNGTVTYAIEARVDGLESMPADMRTLLTNNMPKDMVVSVSGNQMYSRLVNGGNRVMAEFITTAEGKAYFLQHDERKAYLMQPTDNPQHAAPKVTQTGETATIAGYVCTKYTIEPAERSLAKQQVWVAKDIPLPGGVRISAGSNPYDYSRLGINGWPLRIEYAGRGPGQNVVMAAKAVSTQPAPAEKFGVPAGYTVAPFKPSVMTAAMLRGMSN